MNVYEAEILVRAIMREREAKATGVRRVLGRLLVRAGYRLLRPVSA